MATAVRTRRSQAHPYILHVPFENLELFLLGADEETRQFVNKGIEHRTSNGAIALRCGVDRNTVHRWRASGRINWIMADEVAVRLGVHPLTIWPEFHTEREI